MPSDDGAFDESNGAAVLLRAALQTLRQTLFHLFHLCCPNLAAEHRYQPSRVDLIRYSLVLAVRTLQFLSLVYPADYLMSEWAEYSLWMTLVGLFRFDMAAALLGFHSAFFYLCASLSLFPVALYFALLSQLRRKPKRGWSTLRFLFRVSVQTQAGVFFLPSLCTFLSALKYTSKETMVEYNGREAQTLVSPGVHYAALLPLGAMLASSALAQLLVYDMFLPNAKQHIDARAHSKVELLGLACQVIAAVSHFHIQSRAFLLHYAICLCLGLTMMYHYFYYLPFYSLVVDWINFMSYFVGAWGSAALITSHIVGSASCGFVLTIFLPAAVGPVTWDLMRRRVAYVERTYTAQFVSLRNMYLGELCIRFSILRYLESNPAKLDESMRDFYESSLSPLFNRHTTLYGGSMFPALWEFSALFSVVQDVNIARMKLTKTATCQFDLEGAFNQYRFERMLSEELKQASEEAVYVSFRLQFDAAKKADEESCRMQLLYWAELASVHPQVDRAEALALHVNHSLRHAKSLLTRLVQTYPKSHLALKLYGSYLTEVLNDTEHGRELINKSLYEESELITRNQLMDNRFSYFDDTNGIMLISASAGDVGTITYINQRASEVLGVSERIAVGTNVAHFIPASVCSEKRHDLALLNFTRFCTSNHIQVPFGFFLQDSSEFIVDVKLQMKPTSLDLKPYFLVAIKRELPGAKEICFIDDCGIIQTHSRGFPVLVGYADAPILCKSLSAKAVLHCFSESIENRKADEVFAYTLPGTVNQIWMKFLGVRIASTSFRLLYATSSLEEVDRWLGVSGGEVADQLPMRELTAILRRRTLRSILRSDSSQPKELHPCFDLNPRVFEMPETDFPPGKSDYGKAKDAHPIDPETVIYPQASSEDANFGVDDRRMTIVMDLRDLEEVVRSGKSDASDPSKVSVAMLSELTEAKPRGQSLASSAISSNSSFSSTKTAMDLLKVVNTSMKRFKYSFLFTNLTVILCVISMLIYLIVSADAYQSGMIVQQLCDRRDLASLLAFDARNLHLVRTGTLGKAREDSFRHRMEDSLERFNAIMQELTDLVDGFEEGKYKDLYLESKVQTWELTAGTATSYHDNLLNVMRKLSLSAQSVLATPLHMLNASHPGLYFLLQNGEGEAMKVMNESTWQFIEQEQTEFTKVLQAISVMAGLAFLLLVACFLAVILPTVIAVDKSNQNIWGFFYKLPFDIVQDLRFHCEERLESTHGADLQQFSPRKNCDAESDRALIQCSRKWPFIFRRLWVYYFLSVGYGFYFYFAVYSNLATLLLLAPEVVNLTGERTLAIQSSYLWLQETRLGDSDFQHVSPWSEASYWPQPKQRLAEVVGQLAALERDIVTSTCVVGSDGGTEALTFGDVCSAVSASDCGETLLVRGTHSAVLAYCLDSAYFASLPGASLEMDATQDYLHNATRRLVTDYSAVLSAKIDAAELEIEMVTTLYCALCLAFYLVVYLPMTAQVRRQLTNIWDIASLIPTEFIERIMRALKKTDTGSSKK